MAEHFLGTLNTVSGGGAIARAKKLADIYIRSNTNAAGKVTDPNVYTNAINTYLAPFGDDLGVQAKILSYQNTVKTLSNSQKNQDSTVAFFKNKVLDGITLKSNAALSDPGNAAQYISSNLDTILMAVDQTIADNESTGKSVDDLKTYQRELSAFASAQRRLVSGFINGFSKDGSGGGVSMDGFGTYIRTNPADNSIVGGTIVPTAYAPKEFADNTQRIETTQFVGDPNNPNAYMPVYIPAYKDQNGDMVAKLGNNSWSGASGSVLFGGDSNSIKENFDISNQDLYPIQPINLRTGQFGSAIIDKNGNKNYYWKGNDGQVRVIDQKSLPDFLNDPMLKSQLEKAVPLGYDDIKSLGTLQTYNAGDVSQAMTPPPALATAPAAPAKSSFFAKAADVASHVIETPFNNPINVLASKAVGAISSFFGRKNKQSPPTTTPPVSSGGSYSAPDVVGSGEKFFKSPQ